MSITEVGTLSSNLASKVNAISPVIGNEANEIMKGSSSFIISPVHQLIYCILPATYSIERARRSSTNVTSNASANDHDV